MGSGEGGGGGDLNFSIFSICLERRKQPYIEYYWYDLQPNFPLCKSRTYFTEAIRSCKLSRDKIVCLRIFLRRFWCHDEQKQ